mmetsp:Transcript_153011/g.264895  ORF Transcript_153011/g.264895 Transcript_153011/m.264895 type:complete len:200 (-) Transcript_153011:279-878(-)
MLEKVDPCTTCFICKPCNQQSLQICNISPCHNSDIHRFLVNSNACRRHLSATCPHCTGHLTHISNLCTHSGKLMIIAWPQQHSPCNQRCQRWYRHFHCHSSEIHPTLLSSSSCTCHLQAASHHCRSCPQSNLDLDTKKGNLKTWAIYHKLCLSCSRQCHLQRMRRLHMSLKTQTKCMILHYGQQCNYFLLRVRKTDGGR